MEILLLGLVVAAIVVVAAVSHLQRKRRREALQQLCLERGWEYRPRDTILPGRLRSHFPLFDRGFGRECRNIVTEQDGGGDWRAAFDYIYKERRGSGRDRRTVTYRYAVAVTPLPVLLPTLRVDSESVLSKLAGMVGFRGIEVESDEFNRRFRVTAQDRTHAFDILHPRAIDFLLEQRLDNWEIAGGYLAVMRKGTWAVADYEAAFGKLRAFQDMIPDYVWRKHDPEAP